MANILDYLIWRGDVPFSVSPFNEVDGLILSEFSYLPMEKVFTGGYSEELTIREISKRYDSNAVDEKDRILSFEYDNRLLMLMYRRNCSRLEGGFHLQLYRPDLRTVLRRQLPQYPSCGQHRTGESGRTFQGRQLRRVRFRLLRPHAPGEDN